MRMNRKDIIRFVKFTFFSASAGIIEMGAFALLDAFTSWRYWPCYLIALVLSVVWNFTLNRSFTFKSDANYIVAMLKVLGYYAVFTPLSAWAGDYLAETLHWNGILVTALNMIANFVTEFLFQKYVVFRGHIDSRAN